MNAAKLTMLMRAYYHLDIPIPISESHDWFDDGQPELDWLVSETLIEAIPARDDARPKRYKLTARGKKMVYMLQDVPLPVLEWIDPRPTPKEDY